MESAENLNLIRMNGVGNDFLIFDAREKNYNFTKEQIINLSSRNNKITKGCDQFIIIKKPISNEDGFMEIYNSDGSEVNACGNATRCVGLILANSLLKNEVKIKTNADNLIAYKISDNEIRVNMGKPNFEALKIPLSENIDTIELPIQAEGLTEKPSAVSIGNPHMVFFIEKNIDDLDLVKIGTPLEKHTLFPKKVNVSFANILDKNNIKLRVFERGVGETLACGTGACATAVSAIRKKFCDASKEINIQMKGGILKIEWKGAEEDIYMQGKVEFENVVSIML